MEFIIDANLPYNFKLWNNDLFIHVFDLNENMSDDEIWIYARKKNLTIVTKDADFSNRALFESETKVIHLKIGNMRIQKLFSFLNDNWEEIVKVSNSHVLTNVYQDRIEGIG